MNQLRTKNNRWLVFALSLACACVLAISGCDDDEDEDDTGGSGGSAGSDKAGSGGDEGSAGDKAGTGDEETGGTGDKAGTGGEEAASGGSEAGAGGGGVMEGCPDHPNVEEGSQGECRVSAAETDPMTEDLTMDAGNEWYIDGAFFVGNDEDETVLTIEAGTVIYGGAKSFMVIQRGSKIMAEGTADAPIVMTSAKPDGERGPEDWGGLVINGRASINHSDEPDGSAPGEAGTGRYGGDDPNDDSGVLKYLIVEFAGNKIDELNELNGIALQGVGSGTEVDYVQTLMNSDDGVEFFGGTVNVKHLVVLAADDDSVDWMGGYSGKIQFVIIEQDAASGPEAERGIEADNLEDANSSEPYSNPTLSNFTIIARSGNAKEGIKLRRGTKAEISNFIVTGFEGPCVSIDDEQTEANVDDDSLTMTNSVFNCDGGAAADDNKAAEMIDAGDNEEGDPDLTDWIPAADSPAMGIGDGPTDSFFDDVDYAGAFDGTDDWTEGWIHTALN